jgi:hypothetical protein
MEKSYNREVGHEVVIKFQSLVYNSKAGITRG